MAGGRQGRPRAEGHLLVHGSEDTVGRVPMSRWSFSASALCAIGAMAVATNLVISAQQPVSGVIKYTSAGELLKPADFREWVFLSSGMGMTYSPPATSGAAAPSRPPSFTNVYVNPASYRTFMQT